MIWLGRLWWINKQKKLKKTWPNCSLYLLKLNTRNSTNCYMTSSMNRQNHNLHVHCYWLPKWPRLHPTKNGVPRYTYQFYVNQGFLIKIAKYWINSFWVFMNLDWVQLKMQTLKKNNLANIQPSRTLVWSTSHIFCSTYSHNWQTDEHAQWSTYISATVFFTN